MPSRAWIEGVEAIPPAADPAELLKAAKGGNGQRGREASGARAEKPKATKAKDRKTTKRTAEKPKATRSSNAGQWASQGWQRALGARAGDPAATK